MRISLKELNSKFELLNDKEIQIAGWIKTLRDSKNIAFIELNDGSYFKNTQVILESNLDNYLDIIKLNVGSAISLIGKVVLTPDMKQPFEVRAIKIVIEAKSTPTYPLQKKRHTLEYLREIAHLRPRTNTLSAVFRIRSVASQGIHDFFAKNDFINVHTPIITTSDCEGAGDMFKVTTLDLNNLKKDKKGNVDYKQDFFEKPASLTVSGQLNAECFALAFSKVYTFGPTFRAEKSYTQRHAAEFWMIEPEIAFANLDDDIDLISNMIKYVVKYVMDRCQEELKFFNQFYDKELLSKLENIVNSDFARITYTEAISLLKKSNYEFKYPVEWGSDLQTEHERYITEQIYKKPVFVTDYPKEIKAFYMRLNDDNKTVAAVDLLVPGVGEIVGGSQREERLELLEDRIKKLNLNIEDYQWYLDLRRYGGVKHAGFGLGFERLIMYLTGVSNIRDVIPFPRTTGCAEF